MAQKLDPKEMVTPDELIYSNMMQIEALMRLLVKKGIITKDELRAEYEELMKGVKEIVTIIRRYMNSDHIRDYGTLC
jgi:hypothetical protein